MLEPGVVIFVKGGDSDIVKEVCAGIEEEGVNYYFSEATKAAETADMSAFYCGIWIDENCIELVIQGVTIDGCQPRMAGHNAGKFVKRQKLVVPNAKLGKGGDCA